ncbi:hypothetical protein [Paucisalibacillus globulus]|uniref:hypothetical protein n=1 Tax=Paucisalibacillus globulus TaxID=351095 RepID=UPI0004200977|nr:hypothetical protein [Paucisalibacillus globulus]
MKKLLFLSLLISIFIGGCSQTDNATDNLNNNENDIGENAESISKDKDQSNSEKEVVEVKNDENIYTHPDNTFSIKLDERISDKLTIEDGDREVYIYYNDTTLLKEKVLIGSILAYSQEGWNKKRQENPAGLVLHYEDFVYLYEANYDYALYSNYQVADNLEDPAAITYPKEQLEYEKDYQLVLHGILNSGFIIGSIELSQEIPNQLDSNQQVGIDIATDMYEDLFDWYSRLDSALELKGKEGFYEVFPDIYTERQVNYPELRQIPFPTYELSRNIVNALDMIYSLSELAYHEEETSIIYVENIVIGLGQYVDVINNQLKELQETFPLS